MKRLRLRITKDDFVGKIKLFKYEVSERSTFKIIKLFNSKSELKIWMDLNNYTLGKKTFGNYNTVNYNFNLKQKR